MQVKLKISIECDVISSKLCRKKYYSPQCQLFIISIIAIVYKIQKVYSNIAFEFRFDGMEFLDFVLMKFIDMIQAYGIVAH